MYLSVKLMDANILQRHVEHPTELLFHLPDSDYATAVRTVRSNWGACFNTFLDAFGVHRLNRPETPPFESLNDWFDIRYHESRITVDSNGLRVDQSGSAQKSKAVVTGLNKQIDLITRKNDILLHKLESAANKVDAKVSQRTSKLAKKNNSLNNKIKVLKSEFDIRVQEKTAYLKVENSKLQNEAAIDQLTGLLNRRYLMKRLDQEFEVARQQGLPLAVLILDIDHFKAINDLHGHMAGDVALASFADCIASMTRKSDVLGRIGGEEFCVILPCTEEKSVAGLAERMRVKVSKMVVDTSETSIRMTTSIGAAIYDKEISSSIDLLELADQALYAAKRSGRNKLVVYD